MSKWVKKLSEKAKEVKEFDETAYQITDDVEELMEDVVTFYNTNDPSKECYPYKKGCIFSISTPERIYKKKDGKILKNKEGKNVTANSLMKFPTRFEGREDQYLLKNCSFRISAAAQNVGIFATLEIWKTIAEAWEESDQIYDSKFFAYGGLKKQYHKLGDVYTPKEEKPQGKKSGDKAILSLNKFLERHEIEDISQIKETSLDVFYSINIWEVIE